MAAVHGGRPYLARRGCVNRTHAGFLRPGRTGVAGGATAVRVGRIGTVHARCVGTATSAPGASRRRPARADAGSGSPVPAAGSDGPERESPGRPGLGFPPDGSAWNPFTRREPSGMLRPVLTERQFAVRVTRERGTPPARSAARRPGATKARAAFRRTKAPVARGSRVPTRRLRVESIHAEGTDDDVTMSGERAPVHVRAVCGCLVRGNSVGARVSRPRRAAHPALGPRRSTRARRAR